MKKYELVFNCQIMVHAKHTKYTQISTENTKHRTQNTEHRTQNTIKKNIFENETFKAFTQSELLYLQTVQVSTDLYIVSNLRYRGLNPKPYNFQSSTLGFLQN